MLVTGDFVFVGDIGRSDLFEKATGMAGSQDKGANHILIKTLEEFIKVQKL